MMYSDKEKVNKNGEVTFLLKSINVWGKQFLKMIDVVNGAYETTKSEMWKDQTLCQEIGSPSKRDPPKASKHGYNSLVLKK